jgi:hypothetical protein
VTVQLVARSSSVEDGAARTPARSARTKAAVGANMVSMELLDHVAPWSTFLIYGLSCNQDPRSAPHDRAHRTPGGPVAKGREGGLFRADYIRAAVCVRARAGEEKSYQKETRGRSHVLNNVPTKIPDQFCAEIHILLRLEHDHWYRYEYRIRVVG